MKRFIKVPVFFLMALVIMEPAGFAADQPLPAANNLTIPDAQSPTQAAQAQANAQQLVASKNNILSLSAATLSITQPVIQNFYDAQGRLIKQDTYVNGQLTESDTFSYDASGQLTQREQSVYDPSTGKMTSFSRYDGQGRIIYKITFNAAGIETSSNYYGYNSAGQLTNTGQTNYDPSTGKPTSFHSYMYDDQGRLINQCTATYDASGTFFTQTNNYSYDPAGTLVKIDQANYDPLTDRLTSSYQYDGLGILVKKDTFTYSASGVLTEWNEYTYNAGQLQQRSQYIYNAAGQWTEKDIYDGQNRLQIKVTFTTNTAGVLVEANNYYYDSTGQLSWRQQYLYSSSTGKLIGGNQYDAQGRLTEKSTLTYDASGVLITRDEYYYDYTYSSAGYLRQWNHITYDAQGNMVKVTASVYSAAGVLISKVENNYSLPGSNLIYYYDSSTGKLIQFYKYDGQYNLLQKTTYTYSVSGVLTQKNDYQYSSTGQLTTRYQYNYNSSTGKLTSSYQYNGLGILVRKTTYTYSTSGILTQKNDYQYNSTGLLTTRYQYIYDPSTGRLIQLNQYDGQGHLIKTTNY